MRHRHRNINEQRTRNTQDDDNGAGGRWMRPSVVAAFASFGLPCLVDLLLVTINLDTNGRPNEVLTNFRRTAFLVSQLPRPQQEAQTRQKAAQLQWIADFALRCFHSFLVSICVLCLCCKVVVFKGWLKVFTLIKSFGWGCDCDCGDCGDLASQRNPHHVIYGTPPPLFCRLCCSCCSASSLNLIEGKCIGRLLGVFYKYIVYVLNLFFSCQRVYWRMCENNRKEAPKKKVHTRHIVMPIKPLPVATYIYATSTLHYWAITILWKASKEQLADYVSRVVFWTTHTSRERLVSGCFLDRAKCKKAEDEVKGTKQGDEDGEKKDDASIIIPVIWVAVWIQQQKLWWRTDVWEQSGTILIKYILHQ